MILLGSLGHKLHAAEWASDVLVALHLVLHEGAPVVEIEVAYLAVFMERALELVLLHGIDVAELGLARRERAWNMEGRSHGLGGSK